MTHDATTSPDHGNAQRPQFDVALRGYERSQVDEHLGRLRQEINQVTAGLRQERDLALNRAQQMAVERDSALENLRAAQGELEHNRAAVPPQPEPQRDQVSLFGDRLQIILATAEQEAAAVKSEADEAAEQARSEAAAEAARTTADANQEAQTLLGRARSEAESTLTAAREEADTTLTAAREEAESTLTAAREEAAATIGSANTEARSTVTNARNEANSTLTTARQEAESTLTKASDQAAKVTGDATAEAERITTTAEQQAMATLDAAHREETAVRDHLTELVGRRDQVRVELTDISSVIEKLLAPVRAAQTDAADPPAAAAAGPAAPAAPGPSDADTTAIRIPNTDQEPTPNGRAATGRPSPQPR